MDFIQNYTILNLKNVKNKNKKQVAKLRKLLNFKFERHTIYNLSEKRIKLLEILVKKRANELILLIEKDWGNFTYLSFLHIIKINYVNKKELALTNKIKRSIMLAEINKNKKEIKWYQNHKKNI